MRKGTTIPYAAHLLAVAAIVLEMGGSEDEAIGGLLHDVGALFLDSYFPVQYAVAMAFAAREKKTAQDAENLVLGIDHVLVGRKIAEHWNFPAHLVAMVGWQG